MNRENPDPWNALTDPSRNERQIRAFEDAWRRGEAPAIADYLAAGGPVRRVLLVELVHVDLELRLKAGLSVRVEDYLARFPELVGDSAAILPLIAAEFQLRRRDEPNLSAGDYLTRFPHYRDELAISLRATVADDPPRDPAGPQGEPLPAVPGYEVVRLIGRGGMGVVYKARQESLGRLVALKFLPEEWARDPVWLERFRREARTASALNHPNICTIHDTGECAGQPFLSMEMIEGRTLESFVGASPDTDEAVRLCGQAAQALAAAHAAGIVHRDIKPANLMVRGDGLLKVLDFGLARRIVAAGTAGSASGGKATDTGMRVGTPLYMSPEQVRAEPVGSAGDVFSLGLVLYELTTGRHPFAGAFEVGILHAIATEPPLPPSRLNPEIPASVDALIRKMLSKDPRERPTAAEVAAGLTGPPDRSGGRPVTPPPTPARRTTVGRAHEMAALRAGFESAAAGSGLMLCVTGEPGLGKTTLVEEFLAEPATHGRDFRVARGRCSERLAGAEAYLPILEVLDSLARGEAGDSAARALRLLAPTWYSQVAPAVAGATSNHAAETAAPSQERLKREFVALVDEVSRVQPLILFLDDVHWADASTVDLLAYLGNHCTRLRLLLVLTYRPAEMRLGNHPFGPAQLDLERHGVCREISLSYLGRSEIDRYLGLTFPGHHFPSDFADRIHTTTEGNPLFMVDLLRYLRDRGVLADGPGGWALARDVPDFQRELPASVRSLIERKLGQLEEGDRRLLAVGSVQGHEFDAAVVARVLGSDAAMVEERLEALDRAHGLVRQRREQVFPDGTLTPRYQFVHVLYQNALYAALQPTRRAAWSATTAQALLSLYGEGSTAVATELALLFEAARDSARAAEFFLHAAENAARRHASREAVVLARRGLKPLAALPDTPDRDRQELRLQMTLVGALQATNGYSSPDAGQACIRARALCAKLGDGVPLLPVLGHLAVFHLVREELTTARALMEQCLRLAENDQNSALSVDAHALLGSILTYMPENALALEHCDKAIALYQPEQHASIPVLFGHNSLVVARCYAAWTLWVLGRPDRARDTVHAALALARELRHPVTLAVALLFAALLHWLRREGPATRQLAEQLIALADEHGMAVYQAIAAVWRGWALCEAGLREEGVAQIREGAAALRLTGAEIYGTVARALLAESLAEQGQTDEGLTALADALAIINSGAGRYWEAELHRLQGELRLRGRESDPSVQVEAEASFRQALDVARRQRATSLELRAVMSLFRLYRRQGRAAEVRPLLAEAFGRFTEGLDTPDLLDAKALLATPSA